MRKPNPAHPIFDHLEIDEIERVVKLGVLIVAELARGNDWSAYDLFENCHFNTEMRAALGSMLDSQQSSAIRSMREAEHDLSQPQTAGQNT